FRSPAQLAIEETTFAVPDLPTAPAAGDQADIPAAPQAEQPNAVAGQAVAQAQANSTITVETPNQIVTIDLVGGDIVHLSLPRFPVSLERQDTPFVLLDAQGSMRFAAQSGLVGTNGPDAAAAGRPRYQSAQSRYSVEEGELQVDLVLPVQNGVSITKRYIFSADDYLIRLQYLINNAGTSEWRANAFGQVKRSNVGDP